MGVNRHVHEGEWCALCVQHGRDPHHRDAWVTTCDDCDERDERALGDRLAADLDRLTRIEAAARWLTDIWADNIAIEHGSTLWEDINKLRAVLEEPA